MLPAPVRAFDAVAERFDARYGEWLSVAEQRAAVRRVLTATFPVGARLLELGGGTGEDAIYLAREGRAVHLTDGSPTMVDLAHRKVHEAGVEGAVTLERLLLEELDAWAAERPAGAFQGAYSNFAAVNCVAALDGVARGLARAVAPGGHGVLVVFGPLPPGEIVTEVLRGRPGSAFRRLSRGEVHARLGGEHFTVRYPRRGTFVRAFSPWFDLTAVRGIGVFVPPSGAEPWISGHPRLLRALALLDRVAERPLAWLGDHVALVFRRRADRVRGSAG